MLLTRNIKSNYSEEEVAAAKRHLAEIKLFSKSIIALNKENQDAFLILLIGLNNRFSLYEIAIEIQDKINEYLRVTDNHDISGSAKVKATQIKTKIANEIVELNKKLVGVLRKPEVVEIYRPYTSIYLATSAFYPISEFMHLLDKGERVSITSPNDLKYSTPLQEIPFKGYGYIAVSPPTSSLAYSHLNDTFKNSGFLVHSLGTTSASAWSKYTNGRSIPVAVTWGLFLLAVGIHPLYRLEHRDLNEGFFDTVLFRDLFPNWEADFNVSMWERFGNQDLKPFPPPKNRKHEVLDLPALRKEFEDGVNAWYKAGNALPDFPSSKALIEAINRKFKKLPDNLGLWKDINALILQLSREKAFPQSKTRFFIAAYAIENKFPNELDDEIFKLSSIASFLHFDANPSSNIYTMLRYLADDSIGDVRKIAQLTGVSNETWTRYEQGTRIPHSAPWTSTLLCLDLHPIYRIKKRVGQEELLRAYNVYRGIHQSITPKIEEFHLHDSIDFNDFLKIAK